jgi:hypothetical protein
MSDEENSWGKVLEEFEKDIQRQVIEAQQAGQQPKPNLDALVNRYILDLFSYTNRPLLIYAVDFFNQGKVAVAGDEMPISIMDKDGIVEATKDLSPGSLDIIIHSPGGSLEATESIVGILRKKFSDIRFIIPSTAKSAATMLALSGDEIILADSSELGPIDPQMIIRRDSGQSMSPAQAIIDQFQAAEEELSSNPNKLPAWIPILPMYGPSLYQDCKNALKLSKEVVRTWLVAYMFKNITKKSERVNRARRTVNYFANHKLLKSHGRRIGLEEIQKNLPNVLKIKRMEDDPILYNKVMGVYYAILQLFQRTPAFKIIWNNKNKKYIKQIIQLPRGIPIQQPQS